MISSQITALLLRTGGYKIREYGCGWVKEVNFKIKQISFRNVQSEQESSSWVMGSIRKCVLIKHETDLLEILLVCIYAFIFKIHAY